MNLESTDLVKLEKDLDHGRVIMAATDIKTGSRVIRESPVDFLTKFEALPVPLKEGVLDMHYVPLNSIQLIPLKYEWTVHWR